MRYENGKVTAPQMRVCANVRYQRRLSVRARTSRLKRLRGMCVSVPGDVMGSFNRSFRKEREKR